MNKATRLEWADVKPHRYRLRPLIVGVLLGILVAGAAALMLLFSLARGTLPVLTEETLAAAITRWEQHGPRSYRLSLLVTGARGGTVELEVRNGEPVNLLRDGRTPAKHTWDFWTVPGQFEAMELERTGDPQAMFGVARHSDVVQRAEFDSQLGYPRKYQRHVLGRDLEAGWQVLKFEALE